MHPITSLHLGNRSSYMGFPTSHSPLPCLQPIYTSDKKVKDKLQDKLFESDEDLDED